MARTTPTEAAASLAVVTGLIVWRVQPEPAGFLFLGGLSAYLIVRQVLFPLRGLPRATRHGRTVMLIVAPAVLVASLAAIALIGAAKRIAAAGPVDRARIARLVMAPTC